MKRFGTIVMTMAGLLAPVPVHAIVGCLSDQAELEHRAPIIIEGLVLSVTQLAIDPPCEPPEPREDGMIPVTYTHCGYLWRLEVEVERRLRGDAADRVHIYAAEQTFLVLACDDRPPVDEMIGLRARFYVERESGKLWTLDGPNSIYAWPRQRGAPSQAVEP